MECKGFLIYVPSPSVSQAIEHEHPVMLGSLSKDMAALPEYPCSFIGAQELKHHNLTAC